jgi:hypothetical protein
MDSQLRSHVIFHLAGQAGTTALQSTSLPDGLRPALMAPYRRLDALRHDFPLVLTDDARECIASLSAAIDTALRKVAPPGTAGEGLRKRALLVEKGVRRRVMNGESGPLRSVWDAVVREIAEARRDETLQRELSAVREALPLDGLLADCTADSSMAVITHAWRVVQREKAAAARDRIEHLALRLEAILRADDAKSPAAFTPGRLEQTFGGTHQALFDFAAMSRLLNQPRPRSGLPASRRRRIEQALEVLRAQGIFPADGEAGVVCKGTGVALDEYVRRLPSMVQLHVALQVGALEADGRYVEGTHDAIFAAMDERALAAEDLAFFPDLLVQCTPDDAPQSSASLMEALTTGAPLKVVVRVDDVLDAPGLAGRRPGFGLRESQLAAAAMSLGDVFVLQATAANLLQVREAVQRGLRHGGAALFCIYGGPQPSSASLPSYLIAAAAMQSRAFPTFCYDPGAGGDLASRFSLAHNPQPERDWPRETLRFADQELQGACETVAFTLIDFALCDPRHARHFAVVPRAQWQESLVPAAQWIEQPPEDASAALPYIWAVDEADLLCRLVVDEPLMRAARRCAEQWRRLQELAGIQDSRVERALARERAVWAAKLDEQVAAATSASASAAAVTAPPVESPPAGTAAGVIADPAAAAEPPRNPDEAYVETLRCSTCNECTLAFPKIFAYNEEKQAYLKDRDAATFRQLVEAAEACQVSVIHPGKPRNPDEPGLEELLERAKPFA